MTVNPGATGKGKRVGVGDKTVAARPVGTGVRFGTGTGVAVARLPATLKARETALSAVGDNAGVACRPTLSLKTPSAINARPNRKISNPAINSVAMNSCNNPTMQFCVFPINKIIL